MPPRKFRLDLCSQHDSVLLTAHSVLSIHERGLYASLRWILNLEETVHVSNTSLISSTVLDAITGISPLNYISTYLKLY